MVSLLSFAFILFVAIFSTQILAAQISILAGNSFSTTIPGCHTNTSLLSATVNDMSFTRPWSNSFIGYQLLQNGSLGLRCFSSFCSSTSFSFIFFPTWLSSALGQCYLAYTEWFVSEMICYIEMICIPTTTGMMSSTVSKDYESVLKEMVANSQAHHDFTNKKVK